MCSARPKSWRPCALSWASQAPHLNVFTSLPRPTDWSPRAGRMQVVFGGTPIVGGTFEENRVLDGARLSVLALGEYVIRGDVWDHYEAGAMPPAPSSIGHAPSIGRIDENVWDRYEAGMYIQIYTCILRLQHVYTVSLCL